MHWNTALHVQAPFCQNYLVEMLVSNTVQALEFLYALLLGFTLGTAYVLTHWFGRWKLVMDLIFSIFALGAATAFFLIVCGGLVRGYQLVAIISGMLLVVRLLRPVFIRRRNGQKQSKTEKT